MIKHLDQGDSWKKADVSEGQFMMVKQRRGGRSSLEHSWQVGGRERQIGNLQSQHPLPVTPNPSQAVRQTRDQVFKHEPMGAILIQTITFTLCVSECMCAQVCPSVYVEVRDNLWELVFFPPSGSWNELWSSGIFTYWIVSLAWESTSKFNMWSLFLFVYIFTNVLSVHFPIASVTLYIADYTLIGLIFCSWVTMSMTYLPVLCCIGFCITTSAILNDIPFSLDISIVALP